MSKKNKKKSNIPKNLDIEELLEKGKEKIKEHFSNKKNENSKKVSLGKKNKNKIPSVEVKKEEGWITFPIKKDNFNSRRDAQEKEEQKRLFLSRAVGRLLKKQESIEYKEEKEFFEHIVVNKEVRREELKKEEDNITYTQRFKEKYVVTLNSGSKKENKDEKEKKNKQRFSGTSMGEILNSDEFKEMWNATNSHDEI